MKKVTTTTSLNVLEAEEQVKVAKQALEVAEKDYLTAVRATQYCDDSICAGMDAKIGGRKLSYTAMCAIWTEVCKADEGCIAAGKAIKSAIKVRNATRKVLEAKEELLRRVLFGGKKDE